MPQTPLTANDILNAVRPTGSDSAKLAERVVVGNKQLWLDKYGSYAAPKPFWGILVVENPYLRPEQWLLVDRDGGIIGSGEGLP